MIFIAIISFLAAVVVGALGYGYSSIAVPVALLWVSNRVLNPALVLLEVFLNAYTLFANREALPRVWRSAAAVAVGLPFGITLGTTALTSLDSSWLKFATFGTLLPLILLQAAGFRRAFTRERPAGVALGAGVGVLYSVTTISGPPLAMFLTNQGLARQEFRAAMGLIRTTACILTAGFYANANLFTNESLALLPIILPGVVVGIPVGHRVIARVREESFRRICMSFDAAIVSFGISTLLRALHLVEGNTAFAVVGIVVAIDFVLLRRFFRAQPSVTAAAPAIQPQLSQIQ